MEQQPTPQALAHIPLFSSLPPEELLALSGRMHVRRFRKGEAIIHVDDPGSSFFLIRSGEVKIVRPVESGDEAVVNLLGPGDFFGEMALLDGRPRSASVYALEPAEVLVLPREDFLTFLRIHPSVAIEIIVVLTDRIRNLNAQIEESLLELPQRLARRLLDLGRRRGSLTPEGLRIHVPMTQAELASMVRASRQRVNRVLADWQDRRLIRLGRSEIILLQPGQLEELSM